MPRLLSPTDVSSFRERLCQAAERLFSEQGPAAVTMRQLAIELGCSPMTPYRYFKDKDEILAAVRAAAFDRLSSALLHALQTCIDCSPDAASAAMGRAYVAFALAEPQTYRLMFDLNQPEEGSYPGLSAATARARKIMASDRPALRVNAEPSSETPFGPALWAALHGVIMLHLAGKLAAGRDLTALVESLLVRTPPTFDGAVRRIGRGA